MAVWKKVQLTLYLRDAAVLLMREDPGTLVDGSGVEHAWTLIKDSRVVVYAQKGAPFLQEVSPRQIPIELITDEELAQITARQSYVLRF
jgi:hypothetical protein